MSFTVLNPATEQPIVGYSEVKNVYVSTKGH
jgi:hypothetical protein